MGKNKGVIEIGTKIEKNIAVFSSRSGEWFPSDFFFLAMTKNKKLMVVNFTGGEKISFSE